MAQARTFEDKDAVRQQVPLLVGLFGPSGSGKTFSALRLGQGIQQVAGGDIFVIDTESKRALHYADRFKFRHVEFGAPFGSLDYLAALQYCVDRGARTIIVDSMSHEHEGVGGYLMTQEAELDRIAGQDKAKRDKATYSAWIVPAKQRRQFINGVLQLNANFIFCFRAKDKLKIQGGRPTELGYMPIAGEEFLFEMTVNALLLPGANGVPTWQTDMPGERKMLKLPEQFRDLLLKNRRPLDEEIGRNLAQWARGGTIEEQRKPDPQGKPQGDQRPADRKSKLEELHEAARQKARAGSDTFGLWSQRLTEAQSAALEPIEGELRDLMNDADARDDDGFPGFSGTEAA
ncbi:AAA family ATPase [Methylobacterium oxalidis]|uniref:AAA+ ATPase domain-containing protein n=1 Tax=Methylobacterium oxalidis TaxID=944322 RepID=A0A512J936_9HYPH|nr:AAA family ATPase [Methylobacterium oxalidis]GEP06462.1 hypothetical protein MOX02_45000 [Methylobacterium oxalidis]GJE33514.1 hypothetical protein LDDCCGHA_3714 [Methylobacterium oxalidis]GLS65502.1 hypothetical protein GCM10007888_38840 [Methylobacterium oxalidis]